MKWIAMPMCLLLAAPAVAQSNEEVLKRLDAIEKRLDNVERIPNLGALMHEATRDARQTAKSNMEQKPDFPATLLEAKLEGNGVYLVTTIKNNTGRDASLINAYVIFSDRLENTLGVIPWPKSQGIAAGESRTMRGTYKNTRGRDRFERIIELDRSLVEVRFDVYKIAYKDGEIVKIKDCRACDF